MKRISFMVLTLLVFSSVFSFTEDNFTNGSFISATNETVLFLKPIHFDKLAPEMQVEVFVNYPGSSPVSYVGKTLANFDDALLISANDKVYYIRKKFIEKLVILSDKNTPLIAMTE